MRKMGKIILVGAGPGDPGLLTLKGKEALETAEAVVYDSLVHPDLLRWAAGAEKIFVGKKGGGSAQEQSEIHRILLCLAREGKRVVRLKGGDPFIFGRGGEEASFLAKQKIPFEIVPGVSAGIGVPAYAGIPLTDRRFASEVTFVTGHEDPKKKGTGVDWEKLARLKGTLVSFMGVKNLREIVRSLVRAGKPSKTPATVIEWGTLPTQKVVIGNLGNIAEKTKKARIESPALTVIGDVVKLREKLAWFEKKPLRGKTILVTRAQTQASELVRKLRDEGARVLEFPTIEILPPSNPEALDREIEHLSPHPNPCLAGRQALPRRGRGKGEGVGYDWVVFTSANGVHFFFDRMHRLGKDARIFSRSRVAAIGEKTAELLQEKGVRADLIPQEFTTEALFEALKQAGEIRGKKFLLARSDIAPPGLREALKQEGAREVAELETYRTRIPKGMVGAGFPRQRSRRGAGTAPLQQWLKQEKIDYVTFTSSSTVRNFFEPIPPRDRKKLRTRFVSIGPVTSETLREYGFQPAREAQVHTIDGLVATICNGVGATRRVARTVARVRQ